MNAGPILQRRRPRGEGQVLVVTAIVLAVLLAFAPQLALAAGNPPAVQTFYIPFPEDQLLAGLKAIDAGNSSTDPASPITTYISLAAVAADTRVYYDQWENGYEYDISNPANVYSAANPGGTQIWGDADPANGVPPGVPSDIINAGTVIILNNPVNTATQQTVIDFDGRDKIAVTKNIAVTRTGWAAGSNTLLAGSVEVYDTVNWGTLYRAPVGENIPDGADYQMFEYTGLAIMAGQDGATISVDANADGDYVDSVDVNGVTLAEGESRFVNGGVNVGARVVSDIPVQVDILTGDRASAYESRDSALLPVSLWTNSYYTPVATYTVGTTVWLYNPGTTSLTVTYERRVSGNLTTSSLTVPAGSYLKQALPANTPAHFYSGGAAFYAFSATDSTNASYASNQAWDWGFSLVPQGSLTPQLLIGLGIGRDPTSTASTTQNGNPVWVTAIGNRNTAVPVYVDFDADPATGPLIDPNGNRYNVAYNLRELDLARIYDTVDRNQSGLLVYVLAPGVKLAGAWGQDPLTASASAPGLDVGTSVPPCPLFSDGKNGALYADNDGGGFITAGDEIEYTIVINNISRAPVPDVILLDNLPVETTYVPNSTYNGAAPIPDNPAPATAFPLDEGGTNVGTIPVGGTITVTFRVILQDPLPEDTIEIINTGSATAVGVTIPFEDRTPLGGIGDFVWNDFDKDGIQDAGEAGIAGVTVKLYDSTGTLLLATATTGPDGYYAFTGLDTGSYIVEFTKPAGSDPSPQNQGADDALDSDADPVTGRTAVFPWTAGEILRTIDAGFWLPMPRIDVTKTANPTSVPETGGGVTFTFVVANTGNVPATLTALSDDKFGTLAGDGDCQAGTVLAVGTSCAFDATFTVPPGSYPGTHVDVFTATATGNGVTVSDTDDATVTYVDVLPVISVTKVASPLTRPEPGGEFTFTYVVTNDGTVPVVVTSVTDSVIGAITLPAGVTLLPGESTAAMTGKWTYTDDGVYPNTVTAVAEDDDGNADTATASAEVTVTDTLPVISVTKVASPLTRPEPGGEFTFTYVVTNDGTVPVIVTSVTDSVIGLITLPADVALDPGESTVAMTGKWTYTDDGLYPNTVTAKAVDDDGNEDTATASAEVTVTDTLPVISVTKVASPLTRPEPGGEFTFTYVVTNDGTVPVVVTSVTDSVIGLITLPADVALDPGESTAAMTGKWTYTDDGLYPNTVTAVAEDDDGNEDTATASASVTVTDTLPVISVTKVASPLTRPEPGGEFTFTYVVTNDGTVPVVVTSVTDSVIGAITLPVDVTLLPGESTAAMTGKWTYTDDGVYPNTVTAVAVDDDGNEATATATASVTVTDTLPDIAITKTANPVVVPETGGNVEFTIVVTNNGPEPATITSLADTDFNLSIFCQSAVGTVLAPGQTYTCSFTAFVSGDFESGIPHEDTATVVASDDDGNSDTASDDATVTFTDVDPLIDVEKYVWDGAAWQDADAPTGPSLAAAPLFKFVVTNTGPVALSQLTLSDLPAIAQFYAEPALTNPCVIPTGLAPAGTFTCYGTLPWQAGQQADTATATGRMPDGAGFETATDSDSAHYFGVRPSFTVTKACVETGPVPQEGPAHFTVTFHNDGATDLTITADDGIGTFILAAGATRTFDITLPGPFTGLATANNTVNAYATYGGASGQEQRIDRSASASCRVGSRVNMLKLTNGAVNPGQSWTFSLWAGPDGFGGEHLATANTLGDLDGLLDFANAKLDRYDAYTLCEENIPACWTPYWQVDTNNDGVADTSLTPYNPNTDDMPPQDFGHRCVDFGGGTPLSLLLDGGTLLFQVDNTHGEGEPRTPGYWKNWSTCSGGNQAAIALANGGWQAGFWLLDDVLNPAVGGGITWDDILPDSFIFPIDSCELGVSILSGRDFADGANRNSDAAYTLAKHLLAAQANFIAGARTCDAATDAAREAETLLDKYDFDATGPFLDTWTKPLASDYAYALELAAILDRYNNGRLCVGPAVSFIAPLEGDTVAGSVTIRVNVKSPVAVSAVEFFVDGAAIGTDTTAGDGWSILWDSTAVPDGSHLLAASATNTIGQTGSADIVVLVDNIIDPPVVTITAPLDGATLSGTSALITADASAPSGVTQVAFAVHDMLDNLVFSGTDIVAADGWSATWDLTGVEDGPYSISATATATGGQTATATIDVTVDNAPDTTITVASLATGSVWFKRNVTWAATVRIGVAPALDGAVVAGMWSNGDAVICTTGTSGPAACSVTLTGISKKTSAVTFQVTGITLPGYTYVPTTGLTSVTVNRP